MIRHSLREVARMQSAHLRRHIRVAAVAPLTLMLLATGGGSVLDSGQTSGAHSGEAPTAAPSRIILTPTRDSRTTQAVTWRTNRPTKRGFVQVRRVSGGKVRTTRAREGRPLTFPGWEYTSRHHTALARGLRPGTRYRYRVGTSAAWSSWKVFTTAYGPNQRWSFAYFGDAQAGLRDEWAASVGQALRGRPDVDLMIQVGDLVDEPTDDRQWDDWFRSLWPFRRTMSTISAVGNHDLEDDPNLRHYRSLFSYPRNGPKERPETAYSIDYQGVRFIVLDTNHPSDAAQRRFARKKLRNAGKRWTVVVFHQPIFAAVVGRDSSPQRDAWRSTLERYRADLVLQGHDHAYARGYARRGSDHAAGPHKRPMYAVAVAGGKYYPLDEGSNDWGRNGARRVEAAGDTSTYQIIQVTPRALTYRSVVSAHGPDAEAKVGETLDRFRIER